jgi:acetyl esterase/lipase
MGLARAALPPRSSSRTLATWLAVISLCGTLVACEEAAAPGPTSTTTTTAAPASCRGTGSTATRDVRYRQEVGVDRKLLSLDHHVPTRPVGCGRAPIVVYVHGGGFRIGDKAKRISDKVDLFTAEGWVFVSVNYRLSTAPATDPDAIRYPTHARDVAAAIDWTRDHSAALGGDPDRIFLLGHSSGAFLVSLLSTDTSFLSTAGVATGSVRCTVSLDTEYDVADQVAQGGTQEALYRNAFGDDPEVWERGSPINHTAAGAARPELLVYTRGAARRIAGARDFTAALAAGGTPSRLIDVNPMRHEDVNAAVGAPGETRVTPALLSFLRSCT